MRRLGKHGCHGPGRGEGRRHLRRERGLDVGPGRLLRRVTVVAVDQAQLVRVRQSSLARQHREALRPGGGSLHAATRLGAHRQH